MSCGKRDIIRPLSVAPPVQTPVPRTICPHPGVTCKSKCAWWGWFWADGGISYCRMDKEGFRKQAGKGWHGAGRGREGGRKATKVRGGVKVGFSDSVDATAGFRGSVPRRPDGGRSSWRGRQAVGDEPFPPSAMPGLSFTSMPSREGLRQTSLGAISFTPKREARRLPYSRAKRARGVWSPRDGRT